MALNRALHPYDYGPLERVLQPLSAFESTLGGVPYRKDHAHRMWEYGNALYQLGYLNIPPEARIIDTGSGASFFPLYLRKVCGYQVDVNDSMHYGDITSMLINQCVHLGIEVPIVACPIEDMHIVPSNTYDVTMCISVIEHVDPAQYEKAWQELCRITKPGGYLFVTSDYFKDKEQWERSPYRQIQHNPFTEAEILRIPSIIPVEFVGGVDLEYKGDFVHNYSFCNMCLRKLDGN